MRRTHYGCAGQQAVRKSLAYCQRLRRAGCGDELGVFCNQLNLIPDPLEYSDMALAHLTRIQAALADTIGNIDRKEERHSKLFRPYLDPDFFILLMQREETFHLDRKSTRLNSSHANISY